MIKIFTKMNWFIPLLFFPLIFMMVVMYYHPDMSSQDLVDLLYVGFLSEIGLLVVIQLIIIVFCILSLKNIEIEDEILNRLPMAFKLIKRSKIFSVLSLLLSIVILVALVFGIQLLYNGYKDGSMLSNISTDKHK